MPTADVVVAKAELREMPSTITLVGTVDPLKRSLVGSEMSGIVSRMPVRQGDYVEKGTVCVKLNSDSIRWRLAEERALFKAAEARLRRWDFEMRRLKRLYGDEQANEKEVYDAQAEHDVAQYTVEQQKAAVDRLETDLGKTEILAPFAGFIVRRETEVGQWVPTGGAIVEIIDLSSVLVRIDVPEFAIHFVHVSDTARVRIDALKRLFQGVVRHTILQADAEARTFPVEIVIDNSDRALAGGMFARVTIVSGPKEKRLVVPKDAIVERDGTRYVGLVVPSRDGGTSGLIAAVTTGADLDDWVSITSDNITPGTKVIVRGNERLFPFPSPVRIVDRHGVPVAQASTTKRAQTTESTQ